MKKEKDQYEFTSKMRFFGEDEKEIAKLEKSGDTDKLTEAMIRLDKKQAGVMLSDIPGFDSKLINYEAFIVRDDLPDQASFTKGYDKVLRSGSVQSTSIKSKRIIPFKFRQVKTNGYISGPEVTEVTRGVLGVHRFHQNEYSIFNPGDTSTLRRIHRTGSLDIEFSAYIPVSGQYMLMLPSGQLTIWGMTRVLGHGNFTTCYDAKVWVDFFYFLSDDIDNNKYIEASHVEIHYDGTRDTDSTRYFFRVIDLPARYVVFNASAGKQIVLILKARIDTAANKDGKVWGYFQMFGLPAKTKTDYDTVLIKL